MVEDVIEANESFRETSVELRAVAHRIHDERDDSPKKNLLIQQSDLLRNLANSKAEYLVCPIETFRDEFIKNHPEYFEDAR
jgi:hypothetical protein